MDRVISNARFTKADIDSFCCSQLKMETTSALEVILTCQLTQH